jgi:hypothetical protein
MPFLEIWIVSKKQVRQVLHRKYQVLVLKNTVLHVLERLGEHSSVIREGWVAIQDSNVIYGHIKLELGLLPEWCTEDFLKLFKVGVDRLHQHISDHP